MSPLKNDKIVYIEKGKNLKEISFILEKNNILPSSYPFYFYFRILGMDKSIKAGEYLFKKNVSFFEVLKTFNKNNLTYRKITIPECYTIKEVLTLLKNNKYISGDIINAPEEGSIFPDTYYFLRNVNGNDLIKRMQSRMTEQLEGIWHTNYKYFKSKNDLLIMASMIEAEAKKKHEKYLVSSVFHNRLKRNMRLQSDPTILYAKNLTKTINKSLKIYKKDLQKDNPWNTYTRKGMPLTPICNPGVDAIKAAANPYITEFLYFVSDGKGGHRFSNNLKEHNNNVRLWKRKKNEKE